MKLEPKDYASLRLAMLIIKLIPVIMLVGFIIWWELIEFVYVIFWIETCVLAIVFHYRFQFDDSKSDETEDE